MTAYSYREGSTEPIEITLYSQDGVPADLTGYTAIKLFLRSADKTVESMASNVDDGITVDNDLTTGIIHLNPDLLTNPLLFLKSSYLGYVLVSDSENKRTTFPSDSLFSFEMLERFAGDV